MPLVPLDIVKQWYKKDSLVYINFAFLFENPLWSKPIPKGFSLCPYFWLSIFSFLFVRPIIGLTLCLKWLVKKSCLCSAVRFTDKLSCRFLGMEYCDITTVLPTVVISLVVVCGLVLVSIGVTTVVHFFSLGILFPLLFAGLVATSYIIVGKYRGDCEPVWYARVITIVTLGVSALLYGPEMWEVIKYAVSTPFTVAGFMIGVVFELIVSIFEDIKAGVSYIAMSVVAFILLYCASFFIKNTGDKTDKDVYTTGEVREKTKQEFVVDSIWAREHEFMLTKRQITQFIKRFNLSEELESAEEEREIYRVFIVRYKQYVLECDSAKQKRDEMCVKYTNSIKKVFMPFITFGCLVWELIKAKKQGACPYIKFEDSKRK